MSVNTRQSPHRWRRNLNAKITMNEKCEQRGSFKENRNKKTYIQNQTVVISWKYKEERGSRELNTESRRNRRQTVSNLLNEFAWTDSRTRAKRNDKGKKLLRASTFRNLWETMIANILKEYFYLSMIALNRSTSIFDKTHGFNSTILERLL